VREADWARRIMHAAVSQRMLPKGISDQLMTVHAKRPFPDAPEEIAAIASQVRDPNFRVQVSQQGCTSTTATGCAWGRTRSNLWPQLKLENDAGHAFYMGVETRTREIAWQLGKRYVQDQPLDWGCAAPRPTEDLARWCAPGTTMKTSRKPNAAEPGVVDAAAPSPS
jgi:hypothetical protein